MSDEKIAKRYYEARLRAEARYRCDHDYGGGDDIQMLMDHADAALEQAAQEIEAAILPAWGQWATVRTHLASRIRALRSDGGGR